MWTVLKDNLFPYLVSVKASQQPTGVIPMSQRKNQPSGCEARTHQQLDVGQGFPSAGWLSAEERKTWNVAKVGKQIKVVSVDFCCKYEVFRQIKVI